MRGHAGPELGGFGARASDAAPCHSLAPRGLPKRLKHRSGTPESAWRSEA